MKHIYLNLLLLLLLLGACKKETDPVGPGTSALTIVNGLTDVNSISTLFSHAQPNTGTYYVNLNSIPYSYSRTLNSYSGWQQLALYQIPDTLATSKPVYTLTLNLPVNTIHTLFLMGTSQSPDTLFTTDILPYHPPADTVIGVRFVNISKNSVPVSVNLLGQPNGSTVTSLPYKGVSAFKNYNADATVSSYTFEFRDKATGELMGSCLLDGINAVGTFPSTRRYKNFTLAFIGAPGDNAPNKVLVLDASVL